MAAYEEVEDGKWIRVTKRGHKNACCDCDLVHRIDYRVIEGTLEIRVRRDNRATAAMRRKRKTVAK